MKFVLFTCLGSIVPSEDDLVNRNSKWNYPSLSSAVENDWPGPDDLL